MKLLQRTSRYQLFLAIPMLMLGTAIGYVTVNAVVTSQVDEQMEHETWRIQKELENGRRVFATVAPDELITVRSGTGTASTPKDTALFDKEDGEEMPWRIRRSVVQMKDGSPFTITVGRSLLETEDLVLGVAGSMAALLALVIVANLLLGRWLASRLWRPFQSTLDSLATFQLDGDHPIHLPLTDIDEFSSLNRTLAGMMKRLRSDYTAQKRFTEQAAHELQTPLAIMQGKLDELIQFPHIAADEAVVIDGLFQARERMGRTLANMLLLARIENLQYPSEHVDWKGLFEEQRSMLNHLMEEKGIRCSLREDQPCLIPAHRSLAEVMVANLMRNAVQHNLPHGTITVTLGSDGFAIANTGPDLAVPPSQLFERFAKGDPSSASTGLGLSLVKEIAERCGLQLAYGYAAGVHTLVARVVG